MNFQSAQQKTKDRENTHDEYKHVIMCFTALCPVCVWCVHVTELKTNYFVHTKSGQ